MTPQDVATLARIEEKLDALNERIYSQSAEIKILGDTVAKQDRDVTTLKTAYNKTLGVLAFLTFPGVMTTLWLGMQLYYKKP